MNDVREPGIHSYLGIQRYRVSPRTAPDSEPRGSGASAIGRHLPEAGSNAAPSRRYGSAGGTQSAFGGHGSLLDPPITTTCSPTQNAWAPCRGDSGDSGTASHPPSPDPSLMAPHADASRTNAAVTAGRPVGPRAMVVPASGRHGRVPRLRRPLEEPGGEPGGGSRRRRHQLDGCRDQVAVPGGRAPVGERQDVLKSHADVVTASCSGRDHLPGLRPVAMV